MKTSRRTNWPVMLLVTLGTIFILFPLYMTVTIALKNPEQMAHSAFAFSTELHGKILVVLWK